MVFLRNGLVGQICEDGSNSLGNGQQATTEVGKTRKFGVMAWQPDSKPVVHHGFHSNGDYFTNTYDKHDGNRWPGSVVGVINGEKGVGRNVVAEWGDDVKHYKDDLFTFEARRNKK